MKNHGGKRAGAGRPKGTTRGINSEGRSVSLTLKQWEKVDRLRGVKGLSRFFSDVVARLTNKLK
jgi:hypothetical protein